MSSTKGFFSAIKYTEKFLEGEAQALAQYTEKYKKNEPDKIPFFKDFCSKRGYPSTRISTFSEKNENFKIAREKMKDVQESKLFYAGLSGKVSTAVAIFALKNVAGWRDKHDIDSNQPASVVINKITVNGQPNKSRLGAIAAPESS